jgi:hypothetical protein
MHTVTFGTIDEWIQKDPDALLINRKISGGWGPYFPSCTCVTQLKKLDEPIEVTYESPYPDGEPYFMVGSRCPYISKGEFNYIVTVLTIYGSGTSYPLTDSQANDPNWENVQSLNDLA